MDALKNWLEKNGPAGRKRLLEALRENYPLITSTSITHYSLGKRIPDKEKAEIIARIIEVPLSSIPYRVTHIPGLQAQNV